MTDSRITERRNPATVNIDLVSSTEIVGLINTEDQTVAAAVGSQRDNIARAVDMAEAAFRRGGRLIYVGAGTSGRLGVLDASECPPTFGVDPEMVIGIIAGGNAALTRSQEGAEDDLESARRVIDEHHVDERDFVVGIAASGTTPFVHAALRRANELGAQTAVVACSPPPQAMLDVAHIAIIPIVGPEVLTGSTRMKAGTATKLVLNTISTGAMIRIGKTYGNLMVDLRATNAKLADRAERIVMEVCGVARVDAQALLAAANGSVKTAIVMRLCDVSRAEAEQQIERAGGVIRRVISGIPLDGTQING